MVSTARVYHLDRYREIEVPMSKSEVDYDCYAKPLDYLGLLEDRIRRLGAFIRNVSNREREVRGAKMIIRKLHEEINYVKNRKLDEL